MEWLKQMKWGEVRENMTKREVYIPLIIGSMSLLTTIYGARKFRQHRREKANAALSRYFSSSYIEAREKFLSACREKIPSKYHATHIHSIEINREDGIYIDVVHFPCAPKSDSSSKLTIHISGTHGVEGYAGSAIQLKLVQDELKWICQDEADADDADDGDDEKKEKKKDDDTDTRGDILFIHALNPYGMAFNRRFTKENIDLNRNCLKRSENEWADLSSDDAIAKDKVGNEYAMNREALEMADVISPSRMPTYWEDDLYFWVDSLKSIMTHGMPKLRKVIVNGQYSNEKGLFFGGKSLSFEHESIEYFLTNQFEIDKRGYTDLKLIDVHTGLGKCGDDTLLFKRVCDYEWALKNIMPYDRELKGDPSRIQCEEIDTGASVNGNKKTFNAFEIYSHSIGGVTIGLFDELLDVEGYAKKTVRVTQEFGTVAGLFVFKALRNENMAFNYANRSNPRDKEILYQRGMDLRNVFYCHDNPQWKENVLKRGVSLFQSMTRPVSE